MCPVSKTVSLEKLLAESDYVVPLAVATAETENLIGEKQFQAMKQGAFFINVSRGNLVDEAALVRALDSGRLGGCALDVGRAPDQMPTPALAARADVIATPHTAGLTLPAIEHQSMETVAQAAEILKGRAPKGAVNAEHWTTKGIAQDEDRMAQASGLQHLLRSLRQRAGDRVRARPGRQPPVLVAAGGAFQRAPHLRRRSRTAASRRRARCRATRRRTPTRTTSRR